ncbi:hypothetical protein [Pseudonocardia eucalypti]|uniref:hypothetical protein n=1 Tax=Pseudonocardia eucalypti TaxID=648755 RepID=UPI0031EFD4AB
MRALTRWTPGRRDAGRVDECSLERAVLLAGGLSEEEHRHRAFRAAQLERVAEETPRAASAAIRHGHTEPADETMRHRALRRHLGTTIPALNLMGIQTLWPGEPPFDAHRAVIDVTRVYLRGPGDDQVHTRVGDSLDALGGLIGEFHRSTVFLNGLRIEPKDPSSGEPLVLVAAHPAIMLAFGEFLARKYVLEGWTLYEP